MNLIIGLSIVTAIYSVVIAMCTRSRRKMEKPAARKLSPAVEKELKADYEIMIHAN